MSENGEIYTASKNFTLPPALTALTNFNSEEEMGMKKRKKKRREMEEGPGRPHQVLLGSPA